MNTTAYDIIISVIIAFAMVLMVTIALGAAHVATKFIVIPCIFCGTGFVLSTLINYRNRVDNG